MKRFAVFLLSVLTLVAACTAAPGKVDTTVVKSDSTHVVMAAPPPAPAVAAPTRMVRSTRVGGPPGRTMRLDVGTAVITLQRGRTDSIGVTVWGSSDLRPTLNVTGAPHGVQVTVSQIRAQDTNTVAIVVITASSAAPVGRSMITLHAKTAAGLLSRGEITVDIQP